MPRAADPAGPAEVARLTGMLAAVGGYGPIAVAVVPLPPAGKARPRLAAAGHVHSARPSAAAQADTALVLTVSGGGAPRTGNVALAAVFYRPDLVLVDVDNLLKLLMDAGTGVLYRDDSQVTGSAQAVELDRDRPRTVLAVSAHTSTLERAAAGGRRRTPVRRPALPAAAGRPAARLLCLSCRQPFRPARPGARFCCATCATDGTRR